MSCVQKSRVARTPRYLHSARVDVSADSLARLTSILEGRRGVPSPLVGDWVIGRLLPEATGGEAAEEAADLLTKRRNIKQRKDSGR